MDTPDLSHLTSKDYDLVYEPAEDSFLMLDALENDLLLIKSKKPLIVEIGSGSGVNVTALSQILNTVCFATDINPHACEVTENTAVKNQSHVQCFQMDLLKNFRKNMFDIIIFNPPYVVTTSDEIAGNGIERSWAGGIRGREVLDQLLPVISDFLAPKGLFYLVTIEENDPVEICDILSKQGFAFKVIMERRVRGEYLKIIRFSQ